MSANPVLIEARPESLADYIGALRADIANLNEQLKGAQALLQQMVGEGGEAEGELFRVKVVGSDRNTVNWRKVAEKLEPSSQLVTAHTSQSHVVSFRVTARK